MKFFEILTQYDLQLEDGSYVDSSRLENMLDYVEA